MARKNKTRFTFKKICMLGTAIILFSALISVVATANSGNNRAAYFLQNALVPGGSVENGVPPIEGIDPLDDIPEGEIRYNICFEIQDLSGRRQQQCARLYLAYAAARAIYIG